MDFANIGTETTTDFPLSHLSGSFGRFASFYPQLLTTLLTGNCLVQFKVNLFSQCCCADGIFFYFASILFKRVLCRVRNFDRTNFPYLFLLRHNSNVLMDLMGKSSIDQLIPRMFEFIKSFMFLFSPLFLSGQSHIITPSSPLSSLSSFPRLLNLQ